MAPSAPPAAPSSRHISALDGLRGLAVLIVFFFHYAGGTHSSNRGMRIFGLINKGGWSGVTLFFVLSGFLITGILWDSFADPHWWRNFFARRSLRIFPLYFLTLLLVVLASVPAGTFPSVAQHIWIPLLFLENFPSLGQIADNLPSSLAIFHLWSIAVEEQFYLLWPFLLVLQKNRVQAKYLCLGTFLGSCVFRFVLWSVAASPIAWEHFLPTQAGALALGGWLALSYRGPEWPRLVRMAPFATTIGLAGFVACGIASQDFTTQGRFMMTLGLPSVTVFFTAILALAVQPGRVARIFSIRPLRWLGTISYGFYIFHMLFVQIFSRIAHAIAGSHGQMAFQASLFLVAGLLSMAVALVSFHLYEKPFLKLKKYFIPAPARPRPEDRTE